MASLALAVADQALADLPPTHPCGTCPVRDIAVCGALDDASLRCFKEGGPTVAYDAGETVAFEGDAATSVYTLTAGLLRLSRFLPDGRRQIAGFLFPGDFLGLTLEKEHAFTVQAVVPSTLCRFPRPRFDSFAAGQPALERRLYALAAQELAAAREQLVLLGRKTATERIASFLLMLARRGRAEGTAADDIRIPVSRADMGDYLGLRIETVSRELSNLKAARVIQFTGRQTLRLCDRDRIEQLAEG